MHEKVTIFAKHKVMETERKMSWKKHNGEGKEPPCVAVIMAALIHVENVEDISHHDLSSWCNRYTDATGIAQC